MPYIRSANRDFDLIQGPTTDHGYRHGADTSADGIRGSFIPMAFQITSPFDPFTVLLPHALVLHVNPRNFNETFNKKIERFQTRGGFVEQHWGDDLGEISCDQSTGAFINLTTGLASILRERTIAWDRYRDLHDLYYNNGSVRDPFGNIVLQGHVMLLYDRGTYVGTFRNISVEETDEAPFSFNVSWTFKVERTLLKIPQNGLITGGGAPKFQSQNRTIPTSVQEAANAQVDQALNDQLKETAEKNALLANLDEITGGTLNTDISNQFPASSGVQSEEDAGVRSVTATPESRAALQKKYNAPITQGPDKKQSIGLVVSTGKVNRK